MLIYFNVWLWNGWKNFIRNYHGFNISYCNGNWTSFFRFLTKVCIKVSHTIIRNLKLWVDIITSICDIFAQKCVRNKFEVCFWIILGLQKLKIVSSILAIVYTFSPSSVCCVERISASLMVSGCIFLWFLITKSARCSSSTGSGWSLITQRISKRLRIGSVKSTLSANVRDESYRPPLQF